MRLLLAIVLGALAFPAAAQTPPRPHNVVLFVADGLRPGMVNERTAPTMTALMAEGVRFTNTHSLFPTFTTANASGLATGHQLGDTGDFSNNIYVGFPLPPGGSVVAPLENNRVLGEVDAAFRRRLPERGDHPQGRARRGLLDGGDRQARPGADLRPHRAHRPAHRHRRRRDGPLDRHPAVGRGQATPDGGPASPADSGARRQRQAGHQRGQRRAAGLAHRRRDQGAAADVQGTRQAFRHRLLVARSRRHAARPGRQPAAPGAGHQRSDVARRHPQRRRLPGPPADGAEGAGAGRHDRHRPHLRSRLLDDLQGKRHELGGDAELQGRPGRPAAARLRRHRSRARARPEALRSQRHRGGARHASVACADRRRSQEAVGRGRRQRRLRPDLSADRRQGSWRPRSSGCCRSRTIRAAFSSTTRWARSRAPCHCRRSR